jgi:50S ribosomal subunit-associated GTPase HflX
MEYNTVISTLDELEEEIRESEERDGNLPEQNLDGEGWRPPKRILLLNKADRLKDNRDILVWRQKVPDSIVISAIQPPPDGMGMEELRRRILALAQRDIVEAEITLPMSDGKALQRIESRAKVLERTYDDSGTVVTMRVRIGRRQLDMLRSSSRAAKVRELNPQP